MRLKNGINLTASLNIVFWWHYSKYKISEPNPACTLTMVFDSWINTSLCYNLNDEEFRWMMMMISAFNFSTRFHFSIIHAAAILAVSIPFGPAFYVGHHVLSHTLAFSLLFNSCLVNFSRCRQSSSGHCRRAKTPNEHCVTETDEYTKWDKININIQNHMGPKHEP